MLKKKSTILLLALLLVCFTLAGYSQSYSQVSSDNSEFRRLSGSQIVIKAVGKSTIIDLYDNETANDLLSQLPLTLTIHDYAGYDEKVVRLQKSLSMKGAPQGDNPKISEFGYYHPGKWLAIYYGYIGYWGGKVPLGRINASASELRAIPGNTSVTLEKIR